ncbi:zinc finger MYND domain-containing protein 10 [Ciona intestinalis]
MAEDGPQHVLLSTEAEILIENLVKFPIKEIGSPRWQKQHEYLEKINMQSLVSASANEDEFVKELLISLGKVQFIIEDLISVEVWKQFVFSVIVKTNFKPPTTIPIYMVLYHEATVANLLETVCFHKEPLESADETVLDLLDYCYRKLSSIVGETEEEITEFSSTLDELQKQARKMNFEIAVKAVSILRYITDAIESLPLSTSGRLMNTHNIPCLLVELLEHPPWTKRSGGKLMKYIDSQWQQVVGPDALQLTKIEGQVWLALYNVLMNPICISKYNFSSFNKEQILKLRSHMNEVLMDQLPVLGQLQAYLQQLSMTEPAPPKSDLILEQLPEVRDQLMRENTGKWKAIAKYQMKNFFNPKPEEIQQQAQRLADTYNFDVIESLISEPPKCACCGAEAAKRCSRCKQEWYCKRECQVKQWEKHKKVCDVMKERST